MKQKVILLRSPQFFHSQASLIIFTIVDDNVQILFVRHSAQQPIFNEDDQE
ncbi:asr0104 [Nostoc sp. PCC 7120 = FACHB-418]|nr:asr0104 [Nostoc sp. PCC 7120 = FACHB-418]